MAYNIDRFMSRANERLMSCAQRALDEIGYAVDDMENIAEQCPEREDIRSCIDEVKGKIKKTTTEAWAIANHWSEHFDGLGGKEQTDSGEDDEPPENADDADEE